MTFANAFGKGKKGGFMAAGLTAAENPLDNADPVTGDLQADSENEFNALQQGFHDRMKAENKRFVAATDSEYWFAVCFKTRDHKEAFLRGIRANMLGDKYLDGHALARLLEVDISSADEDA